MPDSSRPRGHFLPPGLPQPLPGHRWGYGAQSALVELVHDRARRPAGEPGAMRSFPQRRTR